MRANLICTRADVVANFSVLASGLVVLVTGVCYADLVVALAISIYVANESVEVWRPTSNSGEKRLSAFRAMTQAKRIGHVPAHAGQDRVEADNASV
jgi:Co/Zn/Cd efflux system component